MVSPSIQLRTGPSTGLRTCLSSHPENRLVRGFPGCSRAGSNFACRITLSASCSDSVGTRCLIALLEAGDGTPLFLQFKQATSSVLEPHLGASAYEQAGQRVVEGQRLIQATSDVLLGWARRSGKASRKSNLVAKCIGPEHTTNGAPTAGGLRDRDHSRDKLPRTYLALPGAPAPASTPVTKALRPLLERMISFSISIARKNTRPPANRIGHTCNGTASLPKSLCRGPK